MTEASLPLVSSALVWAAISLSASVAHAQSYGGGDQVLTVGAAEFQATDPSREGAIAADGYLYSSTLSTWIAPLRLPDGAWVEQICAYVKGNANDLLTAAILESTLVGSGEVPYELGHGYVSFDSHLDGYTRACFASSFRMRDTGDPDGDGTTDAVEYWFRTSVTGTMGLGAIQVYWKREVSPPPATPTFGDVPASDGAWPLIEAMAASGITAGCGGGNYCPDATLSRRQMAVFLAKALGLQWSN